TDPAPPERYPSLVGGRVFCVSQTHSGQGIGPIDAVVPVSTLVDRLAREYAEARQRLAALATNDLLPVQ
ncbi:hypothetical protein ACFWPJ_30625, partial [Nocardia sp. NPDC058497]